MFVDRAIRSRAVLIGCRRVLQQHALGPATKEMPFSRPEFSPCEVKRMMIADSPGGRPEQQEIVTGPGRWVAPPEIASFGFRRLALLCPYVFGWFCSVMMLSDLFSFGF